jgi:DNA mismatch repair protein MutL
MEDIIQLLPDSVANQIAAGEVIQRPASAVKELLENAVDAGSTHIQLIIKDAGKTLIQVIDNGKGMSVTDARMCFERHATSKIKKSDDLFELTTMGFRGEALASIAAIAQVELKSRNEFSDVGTVIQIEGSEVVRQDFCAHPIGTSIAVKNLFYNVPARRKFLKSDNVEIKHIIDEFQRVALSNSSITFSFHHNEKELFKLEKGTFRQRIVSIFGKSYNEQLVPIEENTNIINISGYIGKPDVAKKTRGDQFFFVNNRFIKSPYLHHAVQSSYEQLIGNDHHPSYFIHLSIDPKHIDINIHPTKTEIKFDDEKSIYAIIRSAVKLSLGKYNIAPAIDFNQEVNLIQNLSPSAPVSMPKIEVNTHFNPFETEKRTYPTPARPTDNKKAANIDNWNNLYDSFLEKNESVNSPSEIANVNKQASFETENSKSKLLFQFSTKYIITQLKSGLIFIDQHRAHERILYEQIIKNIAYGQVSSQQLLFPVTVELASGDFALISSMKEDMVMLGFELNDFGKNCVIIEGLPTDCLDADPKSLLESILEDFKNTLNEPQLKKREKLAMTLANKGAIKSGQKLSIQEMENIIDLLFACEMPYSSPSGLPTIITLSTDDIDSKFSK